jgi:hypothetical protein
MATISAKPVFSEYYPWQKVVDFSDKNNANYQDVADICRNKKIFPKKSLTVLVSIQRILTLFQWKDFIGIR